MLCNLDNACSMVKLAVALLDDNHGIQEEAFDLLWNCASVQKDRGKIEDILEKVKKCEGRVFLPEGWNDDESSG